MLAFKQLLTLLKSCCSITVLCNVMLSVVILRVILLSVDVVYVIMLNVTELIVVSASETLAHLSGASVANKETFKIHSHVTFPSAFL